MSVAYEVNRTCHYTASIREYVFWTFLPPLFFWSLKSAPKVFKGILNHPVVFYVHIKIRDVI